MPSAWYTLRWRALRAARAQGEVDAQAAGVACLGAGGVEDDGVLQGLVQCRLGAGGDAFGAEQRGELAQVHQVEGVLGIRLVAEGGGAHARHGDLLPALDGGIALGEQGAGQGLGPRQRRGERGRPEHAAARMRALGAAVVVGVHGASPLLQPLQQRPDAREVDDAEGHVVRQRRDRAVPGALAQLLVVEGRGDRLAEFRQARCGLARGGFDHALPVPARARLQLLRCAQVAGIGLDRLGHFQRGHQAGIEADVVQRDARGGLEALQGPCHGGQRHHLAFARIVLVAAIAVVAAAVVPQRQHGALCGVGARAPDQEVLQRVAGIHVPRAQVRQLLQCAIGQLEALDRLPARHQAARVALVGAARGDDDAGVRRALRCQHFQQVAGARVAHALQVGAQQVDEQRGAGRAGAVAAAAAGGEPSGEQGGSGAEHVAA